MNSLNNSQLFDSFNDLPEYVREAVKQWIGGLPINIEHDGGVMVLGSDTSLAGNPWRLTRRNTAALSPGLDAVILDELKHPPKDIAT
jgi:hypothetical protein